MSSSAVQKGDITCIASLFCTRWISVNERIPLVLRQSARSAYIDILDVSDRLTLARKRPVISTSSSTRIATALLEQKTS